MAQHVDVVVIGAGAAGLFCGIETAKRGRSVLVIDHANKAGKKILMSGGGRCNFTNMDVTPAHFLSQNPHFVRSALSRYTQWDFIGLVASHGIDYHEKELGQLFCDHSAKDIQQMLLTELAQADGQLSLDTHIQAIAYENQKYQLQTSVGLVTSGSLVVATGGLSIPTMGASDFGFKIAKQFGHSVLNYRASLVPFTWNNADKSTWSALSGLSVDVQVSAVNGETFGLPLLITHRGLSGPAMLQISNYWQPGEHLIVNWLPTLDVAEKVAEDRHHSGKKQLKTWLGQYLPARLAEHFCQWLALNKTLAELSKGDVAILSEALNCWTFKPGGTEGYRTAEVTLGGVDTQHISSKTMMSQLQPQLFFVGEVLDVTGWLGGYNFQWAWSSGWAAGQVC
ncbi:NAD(P)/FAD-dependent oxidoreductase [Reinekea sp. G2M2-21]|uniref:NAD(P)/FAD-dependent oxidoreductase n=1 Tax=Reinekea sp. G2M2-21 TaxID=2788942 RepID=UPI0018AB6CE7|nr:NAD(P)/FAD-dependent oxidoreductase [Reinekea sp. G2M2-21]